MKKCRIFAQSKRNKNTRMKYIAWASHINCKLFHMVGNRPIGHLWLLLGKMKKPITQKKIKCLDVQLHSSCGKLFKCSSSHVNSHQSLSMLTMNLVRPLNIKTHIDVSFSCVNRIEENAIFVSSPALGIVREDSFKLR